MRALGMLNLAEDPAGGRNTWYGVLQTSICTGIQYSLIYLRTGRKGRNKAMSLSDLP